MELSLFLAKIIGFIYIVVGLSVLLNAGFYKKFIPELVKNKVAMYLLGFIGMIVMFIWVLKHNIWQGSWWVLLITLFGWIGLVKSVFILLMPKWFEKLSLLFIKWFTVRGVWGIFGLVLGLVFSYVGWMM
jgi:hypothetical protein